MTPPRRTRATRTLRLVAFVAAALAPPTAMADDPSPGAPPIAPSSPAPPAPPAPAPAADATDAFFAGPILTLRLEVAPEDVKKLRDAPRTYVPCRVREDAEHDYEGMGVKLKGGAGSFRPVDDRPAFTLDADRFHDGQRFHGLAKVHLDNSVQDDTSANEALGAALFTAAGLVAPRVTHARVFLGERDLGLYVVKEGVDKHFLARHFAKPRGDLYDGGFCRDVDEELEKDAGKGPEDRSDLAALVAACREPDLLVRAKKIPLVLDVERFLTFTALERLIGHWDGYSLNRNNYRLYVDPDGGRAVFLPHGMDQLFQDPEASILDAPVGLVAACVLEVPALRQRYRARLVELLPLLTAKTSLLPALHAIVARVGPVVAAMGADPAAAYADRVRELEERLVARETSVREQVTRPDPPGLEFDKKGRAALVGWRRQVNEGEPALDEVDHAARRSLGIRVGAGGGCVASWRRGVVLPRGRYVFEAIAACKGVTPRPDPEGTGAGLRISHATRKQALSGASPWKALSYEFEVTGELGHVELVAELRATAGEVWFRHDSLRLVRKTP